MRTGKLNVHIRECCPDASLHFGVMVAVPDAVVDNKDLLAEYDNPTSLESDVKWELKTILPCYQGGRRRSTVELLFDMLIS